MDHWSRQIYVLIILSPKGGVCGDMDCTNFIFFKKNIEVIYHKYSDELKLDWSYAQIGEWIII